jgi:endonuclease/exonuclease/phosphatase family metal-dependent hydrolase
MWKVVTFNVLHLTHEINHALGKSPVLDKYKIGKFGDVESEISMSDVKEKEQNRLKDLFVYIRSFCEPTAIVCLQEVSGDLLHLLVDQLPDFKVFFHTYSRVPSIKKSRRVIMDCNDIYNDPKESLVTIVHNSHAQHWHSIATVPCESDPGKACLIVSFQDTANNRITIANAHIPFAPLERTAFIMQLVSHLNSSKMFVLTGDTNCSLTHFQTDLRDVARQRVDTPRTGVISHNNITFDWELSSSLNATRRGTRSSMKLEESCIDYFIHRGIVVSYVAAYPFTDVSDHVPVQCVFNI